MRQYLKVWNESTFGVFANPATPVKNTDYCVIRLVDGNAFTMREAPRQTYLRSADGGNRRIINIHDKSDVKGALQTVLFPEQSTFLFNWATALTSGELPSCTIDHVIVDMSNTARYKRYLGVKVANLGLTASGDNTVFKANFDLIGQKSVVITGTDFPEPAQTEYATGRPFVFTDMASPGYLNLGTSRSEFASVDLKFQNILDAPMFESKYVTAINACGRNVSWATKLKFKALTDRTNYEAVTPSTCEFRIDNGTNHLVLTFEGANYIGSIDDDLSLDHCFYQTLHYENAYDVANSTDFSFSYT